MNGDDWMGRRLEARRKGRLIGLIIIDSLAFFAALGVAVNALLAGLGVTHDSSEPAGAKTILIAVAFFAVSIVCAAVVVHVEHRLRGAPPGRIAAAAQASLPRGNWPRGRRRRNSPTSMLITGILGAGMGIAFAAFAFSAHAAASKSSYTQSHGVPDSATVDSVSNQQSSGRGGTTYWANVAATLRTPVDGQRATVVNIPNNVSYQDGQVISVLVDPADPGYSELPGSPYASEAATIGAALGSLVTLLIGAFTLVGSFRMRRRLRALRMQRAAPTTAGAMETNPLDRS